MSTIETLTHLANRIAFQNCGARDTCVGTSYSLTDALHRLGFIAFPLRVEAAVFHEDRKLIGTILGAVSLEGRRPKAEPGMWAGHLAVVAHDGPDKWLLDPTLDQANKPEWPAQSRVGPLAFQLQDDFWKGKLKFLRIGDALVRYKLHPRQTGFTSAPDARPSRWKPLADQILAAMEAKEAA